MSDDNKKKKKNDRVQVIINFKTFKQECTRRANVLNVECVYES